MKYSRFTIIVICLFYLIVGYGTLFARTSTVQGKLLFISTFPNPTKSTYPDCYYAALFKRERIISGDFVPQKIILILPAFIKNKYTKESKYKIGDKLNVNVKLFSALPDDKKSIQQVNQIDDFDLKEYFALSSSMISDYNIDSHITVDFAKQHDSQQQAIVKKNAIDLNRYSAEEIQLRHISIDNDLAKIDKLIKKCNKEQILTPKEYLERVLILNQRIKTLPEGIWYKGTYFPKPSRFTYYKSKKSVNSATSTIYNMHKYFKSMNVDLIVVPYPVINDLSIRGFFPELPLALSKNINRLIILRDLMALGVEVIDPTELIMRKHSEIPYISKAYIPDGHPTLASALLVVKEIKKRLSRYQLQPDLEIKNIQVISKSSKKYYYHSGNILYPSDKNIKDLCYVKYDGGNLKLYDDAPILVFGDSYSYSPDRKHCSFAHLLSATTGIKTTLFARAGGGRTMLRYIYAKDKAFISKRKVAIFIFSSADLASEWSNVNIVSRENFAHGKTIFKADLSNNFKGLIDAGKTKRYTINDFGLQVTKKIKFEVIFNRKNTCIAKLVFDTHGNRKSRCIAYYGNKHFFIRGGKIKQIQSYYMPLIYEKYANKTKLMLEITPKKENFTLISLEIRESLVKNIKRK